MVRTPETYGGSGQGPTAFLGPESQFFGSVQDAIYLSVIAPFYDSGNRDPSSSGIVLNDTVILASRQAVVDTNDMISKITSGYGYCNLIFQHLQ